MASLYEFMLLALLLTKHVFTFSDESDKFSENQNSSIPEASHKEENISMVLPAQWSDVCTVKNKLDCLDPLTVPSIVERMDKEHTVCVSCDIKSGNSWNFNDFRRFINDYSTQKRFALSIRCHDNSNVTLPWPMRAAGLTYISVQNCLLLDYMTEYFDSSVDLIPDSLLYYSLVDIVIFVDIIRFMDVTNRIRLMTKAAKCGPEKELVVSINRNISYTFKKLPLEMRNQVLKNFTKFTAKNYHRSISVSAITCNYSKLVTLDRSISRSLGSKQDILLLQNSVYPELRVLNLSDVLLSGIPQRFNDWRLYFPRLQKFDLTWNKIKDFRYILDYGTKDEDERMGTIDLRYNNITTITLSEINSMKHHELVMVDVRENPFHCDCEMKDFVKHFSQPRNSTIIGVASQYEYLKDLKCQTPYFYKGRRIVDLSPEDLNCCTRKTGTNFNSIIILSVIVCLFFIYIIVTIKYQKQTVLSISKPLLMLCDKHRIKEDDKEDTMIGDLSPTDKHLN